MNRDILKLTQKQNPYTSSINKITQMKNEYEKKEYNIQNKEFDIVVIEVLNGLDVFEVLYVATHLSNNQKFLKKSFLITRDFLNFLLSGKYKVQILSKFNQINVKNYL